MWRSEVGWGPGAFFGPQPEKCFAIFDLPTRGEMLALELCDAELIYSVI